jgi:hypothetical protein
MMEVGFRRILHCNATDEKQYPVNTRIDSFMISIPVGHQNAVGVKNQAIGNKWCSAQFYLTEGLN